jgi:molybdopterin synthase catalytic subunit
MSTLSTAPIDVALLGALVLRPGHGAVTTFTGHVRDHHDGRVVKRLTYSAYAPMAERESERIIAEAEAAWPVSVALRHRIGDLEVGDAAICVAVGSAHRDEGFAACRFVVEEVKRRVPIWKHEFYDDGSDAWVDPTAGGGLAPDPADERFV